MDYYAILGVVRSASPEEIKQAYKKLVMQHHPDRGGDHNTFIQIQAAYEALTSKKTHNQKRYNSTIHRNKNIIVSVDISLNDVLTGTEALVETRTARQGYQSIHIKIPAGIRNNDTITVHGLGDDYFLDSPRGHLHVKIRVIEQNNWRRERDNLFTDVKVNSLDLITGTVILVNTLDGLAIRLSIEQGTQTHTLFSVPGYGVPNLNTGKRGNLFINVIAETPVLKDKNLITKIRNFKSEINNSTK